MKSTGYGNNAGYGEVQENNRYRLWYLVGALGILAVVLAAVGIILLTMGTKGQKYNSYIEKGNRYYSSGDYQNAIVEYQKALEIDEKKSTAYMNLASAYSAIGDYESAKLILSRGIQLSVSGNLRERLEWVENLSNTKFQEAQIDKLSKEEIEEISGNVTLENSIFDMVAEYTYTEYYRDYGKPTSNRKDGSKVVLEYGASKISASYYDMDNEKVLDVGGDMPVATSKPCEVSFSGAGRLFNYGGDIFVVSKNRLQQLFGETADFYANETNNRYYVSAEYKGCRLVLETDKNGNLVSELAWNSLSPLQRDRQKEEEKNLGRVSGYIVNAVTGNGIQATIKVRDRGVKTGNVLAEFTSKSDGSYEYKGDDGNYTLEISAPGYVTEYLDVNIIRGQIKTAQNVVLSPTVAEGEIRIVLTWGANPTDLDSHTDGISSDGRSFHIDFTNQSVLGVGNLDVDDTSSYGPETTTITDYGAKFTFSVVDYLQTGTMAANGATVKVYLSGNTQPITYTVPTGAGNTWTVFRYENGAVTPVNTME